MKLETASEELQAADTAQNRKVFARHASGTDHALALALWMSENHDARVLATRVADPALLTTRELDRRQEASQRQARSEGLGGRRA